MWTSEEKIKAYNISMLGEVEDIVPISLLLLSDQGRYLRGEIISMNG